jgi:glycerate kinase
MVEQLEQILTHYATVIERDLGASVRDLPGAGAAGGLGAGLVAFLDAALESGAEIVLRLMGAERHLAEADLLITGEGQIDAQTAYGKGPMSVAKMAQAQGVPVIALAGSLGQGAEAVYEHGIDALLSITAGPMTLDDAMRDTAHLLEAAAARALRLVRVGQAL